MSTVKKRPAPPPKPGHLSIRTVSHFTNDGTITRGNAHKMRPNIDTRFHDGRIDVKYVSKDTDRNDTMRKLPSPSSSRKLYQELGDMKLSHIADSEDSVDDKYVFSNVIIPTGNQDDFVELPARALYSFSAKTSKELSISAGDEFSICDYNVADGWYMARKDGERGLVPSAYIIFIQDFTLKPDGSSSETTLAMPLDLSTDGKSRPLSSKKRDEDTLSICSMNSMSSMVSLVRPEKFVRQSFFGRRATLFGSSTSALADFVEHGNTAPREQEQSYDVKSDVTRLPESDQHHVVSGPRWSEKTPIFSVSIYNPRRITSRSSEYVLYKIMSAFSNGINVTVDRRFSQFQWLHERLSCKFAYLVLPTLPDKQYSSRSTDIFIEQRRRALGTYMMALVRHPVIRYSDLLTHFLSCDDEDWKQQSAILAKDEHVGSRFFIGLEFSDFNVDEDGDEDVLRYFMDHISEMDKTIPEVVESFNAHARIVRDGANRYRNMSYALLRMMEQSNSDGAWCWREGCIDCLQYSKALQVTAETYLSLAVDHEHYANNETDLLIHDMTTYTKSSAAHAPLLDTHRSTLKQLHAAEEDEDVQHRCEAVFNVVSAEIDRFHETRLTDWIDTTERSLDAQIAMYENMASKLKAAREHLRDIPQTLDGSMDPLSPRSQTIDLDNVQQCKLDPPLACGIAPVIPSEILMDTQATIRRIPPPLVSSESTSSSESSSPSSTTTQASASASATAYSSVLGTVGNSVASIFAAEDTKASRPSVRSSIFESWWGTGTQTL